MPSSARSRPAVTCAVPRSICSLASVTSGWPRPRLPRVSSGRFSARRVAASPLVLLIGRGPVTRRSRCGRSGPRRLPVPTPFPLPSPPQARPSASALSSGAVPSPLKRRRTAGSPSSSSMFLPRALRSPTRMSPTCPPRSSPSTSPTAPTPSRQTSTTKSPVPSSKALSRATTALASLFISISVSVYLSLLPPRHPLPPFQSPPPSLRLRSDRHRQDLDHGRRGRRPDGPNSPLL